MESRQLGGGTVFAGVTVQQPQRRSDDLGHAVQPQCGSVLFEQFAGQISRYTVKASTRSCSRARLR